MPNEASKFKPVRLEIPARGLSRRHFLYTTALAASAFPFATYAALRPQTRSPNDLLNVGCIGVQGKGQEDSTSIGLTARPNVRGNSRSGTENIVAICDVDSNNLDQGKLNFPKANTYRDYREMIEKEKNVDCFTVTVPDHSHAPAAMLAIKAGKGVYVQKPMAHTITEARALTIAAREHKVASQMGNQGHCSNDIRQLCEMIWSGAIGHVREAHCWTNRPWWGQGQDRPPGTDPVPANLDWNLWLGPAPERPYLASWPPAYNVGNDRRIYHQFSWRGWWDFGCGALGDMACHVMDGANWALKLGAPTSVELVDISNVHKETAPAWSIIRYNFPARGDMPPCTLTWYDGGKLPERPKEMEGEWGSSGTIFIGEKGKIRTGEYTNKPQLLPESSMVDYKMPPQTIPRVPFNNTYRDFIRACKDPSKPACSNFNVAGPFAEIVLLGNLILRLGRKDFKMQWDFANMKSPNCPEADEFIKGHYRAGWSV